VHATWVEKLSGKVEASESRLQATASIAIRIAFDSYVSNYFAERLLELLGHALIVTSV